MLGLRGLLVAVLLVSASAGEATKARRSKTEEKTPEKAASKPEKGAPKPEKAKKAAATDPCSLDNDVQCFIKGLRDAGAPIDAMNKEGATALHVAAGKGLGAAVAALLEAGASAEALDKHGETALHHALRSKHAAATAAPLLEHAAKARSEDGTCPASRAALLEALAAPTAGPALAALEGFVAPATPADEAKLSAGGATVPRLAAANLTLSSLEAALRADADGVLLVEALFWLPKHFTFEWAETTLGGASAGLSLATPFAAHDKDAPEQAHAAEVQAS